MSARSGVTPDREVVSIARGLSAIRRLPRSSCHDIRTEDARGTRASTSPAPRVGAIDAPHDRVVVVHCIDSA